MTFGKSEAVYKVELINKFNLFKIWKNSDNFSFLYKIWFSLHFKNFSFPNFYDFPPLFCIPVYIVDLK